MSYKLGYWDDARGSRYRSYAIGGKTGPVIFQGASEPVDPDFPKSGDLWIVTGDSPSLKQFVDGEWRDFGGEGVGPTGPQGPQGPQGDVGPAGPQGDIGPAGPQGDVGPAGPQGDVGPAGADGAPGVDGISIVAANNVEGNLILTLSNAATIDAGYIVGPQGEQGLPGEKGDTGDQGPQGIQGEVGPQGPAGSDATVTFNQPAFTHTLYVEKGGNDTTGDGTIYRPYATVTKAMSTITGSSRTNTYSINLGAGLFTEASLAMKPWVWIVGKGRAATNLIATNPITLDATFFTATSTSQRTGFVEMYIQGSANFDLKTIGGVGSGKIEVQDTTVTGSVSFTGRTNADYVEWYGGVIFGNYTMSGTAGLLKDSVVIGNISINTTGGASSSYGYSLYNVVAGGSTTLVSDKDLTVELYSSALPTGIFTKGTGALDVITDAVSYPQSITNTGATITRLTPAESINYTAGTWNEGETQPVTVADALTTLSARAAVVGPQGPQGDVGPAGPKGDTGDTGPAGSPGSNATIIVDPYWLHVSKVTYTGTPDGSVNKPFASIQDAHDWALTNVPISNPVVINVHPGVYTGNLSVTRARTFFRGHNGLHAGTRIFGNITVDVANTSGDWTVNRIAFEDFQFTAPSGTVLSVTGSNPIDLSLTRIKAFSSSNQALMVANNTVPAGIRFEIDNCDFTNSSGGSSIAFDLSNCAAGCVIKNTTSESGATSVLRLRSGQVSLERMFMGSLSGSNAIQNDSGILNISYSIIYNSGSNTDGLSLLGGTTSMLGNFINVPSGTGFAVRGVSGAIFAHSFNTYQANNKLSAAMGAGIVPLTTTTTTA